MLHCHEVSLTPEKVAAVNLKCHALLNNTASSTVTKSKPLKANHGNCVSTMGLCKAAKFVLKLYEESDTYQADEKKDSYCCDSYM